MADQSERTARLLVRALYYATDGEPRLVGIAGQPEWPNEGGYRVAVDRGWMVDRGDSVCLTEAGQDLVKNQ
jgi:hypothetical protein